MSLSFCSRVFAKAGYRVALIARNKDHLNLAAQQIKGAGGEVGLNLILAPPTGMSCVCLRLIIDSQVAAFPIAEYSYQAVTDVFEEILGFSWPSPDQSKLRVALWNVGVNVFGNFLSVTEADIQSSLNVHVTAGFAFSRRVILAFKENTLDELGCRGTLLFTGATASIRGNIFTSAFAAGKFGIRALSQSLAKEFGQENIHVSHPCLAPPISPVHC